MAASEAVIRDRVISVRRGDVMEMTQKQTTATRENRREADDY